MIILFRQFFDTLYRAYKKTPFLHMLYQKSRLPKYIWRNCIVKAVSVRYRAQIRQRVAVDGLMPKTLPAAQSGNGKIKVRFFINYTITITWNSIEPIISAIRDDPKYDILLLLEPTLEPDKLLSLTSLCIANDLPYAVIGDGGNYSIEQDKPDILIPYELHAENTYGDFHKHTKLIIAPCRTVIPFQHAQNTEELIAYTIDKGIGSFSPDYILLESMIYHVVAEHRPLFPGAPQIVEMGNVKYDRIYRAVTAGHQVKAWEKLNGKRVLLYCPDHGYDAFRPSKTVSFDLYVQDVFKWARENPDVGLIFRLFSALENELIQYGFWTRGDLLRLKQAVYYSPNIVWDEHETHDEAYANCDAILTDAYCGASASALPIGKPIGVLYRNELDEPSYKELDTVLYQIKSHDQLYAFLEMVRTGEDPMKEVREAAAKKFVMHFDGKNAQRIKDFIDEKWREYQENNSAE